MKNSSFTSISKSKYFQENAIIFSKKKYRSKVTNDDFLPYIQLPKMLV